MVKVSLGIIKDCVQILKDVKGIPKDSLLLLSVACMSFPIGFGFRPSMIIASVGFWAQEFAARQCEWTSSGPQPNTRGRGPLHISGAAICSAAPPSRSRPARASLAARPARRVQAARRAREERRRLPTRRSRWSRRPEASPCQPRSGEWSWPTSSCSSASSSGTRTARGVAPG